MVIVHNYALAVVLCFVIMLCWGSWGNTQKAAAKSWRYEFFYCDYVVGMLFFALLLSFTLGTFGTEGRPFLEDIAQAANTGIAVMKEYLGHTPFEVASGAILGVILAFVMPIKI